MPYVTLLEASQIVKNETGIDITVPQLIRAGAMQHLMLCVLLDVKCYSPTHRIRREKRALELDPDYWINCPKDRIDDADVVDAYGLFVLPPRHVFAYQTKETVRVDVVSSLDGLDIYFPGVYVSRDALQITMPHLDAFIKHIKADQAEASPVEDANSHAGSGTTRRWTEAFTAEVQAHRDKHGPTATARHYDVSVSLITNKTQPKTKAPRPGNHWSGLLR